MSVTELSLGTLLTAVTTGGIFFNIYILFFSCSKTNSQSRTATQILLFHLGLLNVFLNIFSLLAFIPSFFKDIWLEDSVCFFIGPVWDCLNIAVIWTIMSLNADKYITIACPLHYARFVSPFRVVVVIFIIWLVSVMIIAPSSLLPDVSYTIRSTVACEVDVSPASYSNGVVHACITTIFGFIIPVLAVGLANGRILIIASHHKHRIVSALWDVTLSAQATVTQQKSHFYLTNYRGKSAASTIFYHVGSLLIMYLPTTVCRVYEALTRLKVSPIAAKIAFVLLLISPTVNGFVYGVKSKILRKTLIQALRKQIYKSEVSCEIQARTPSASCSRRPSITPSITLPIQKQLTRRMSEIFTPNCTTPTSSQYSFDGRAKLERQSSDISYGKSSEASTPISLTPSPFRLSGPFFSSRFFPKALKINKGSDTCTTGDLSTNSSPKTVKSSHSSFGFLRQASLEMMTNVSTHNGGHRQSLRRALFARNKQKSLDLDTVQNDKDIPKSSKHPPRSVSHHHMQEQAKSPSISRPLMVSSDSLTQGKKNKKVSWSSDSFSSSEKSTYESQFLSENEISKHTAKKRAIFRQNTNKAFSRLSLDKKYSSDRDAMEIFSEKYGTKSLDQSINKDTNYLNGFRESISTDLFINNEQRIVEESSGADFKLTENLADDSKVKLIDSSEFKLKRSPEINLLHLNSEVTVFENPLSDHIPTTRSEKPPNIIIPSPSIDVFY
ncbi:UNVERIFIED_CONTAM: hypothetical protein RMT77_016001 [Armadillidium vulgare]